MQYAINTVAYSQSALLWFQVDIGGSSFYCLRNDKL